MLLHAPAQGLGQVVLRPQAELAADVYALARNVALRLVELFADILEFVALQHQPADFLFRSRQFRKNLRKRILRRLLLPDIGRHALIQFPAAPSPMSSSRSSTVP